jgi:hypothetical protein
MKIEKKADHCYLASGRDRFGRMVRVTGYTRPAARDRCLEMIRLRGMALPRR